MWRDGRWLGRGVLLPSLHWAAGSHGCCCVVRVVMDWWAAGGQAAATSLRRRRRRRVRACCTRRRGRPLPGVSRAPPRLSSWTQVSAGVWDWAHAWAWLCACLEVRAVCPAAVWLVMTCVAGRAQGTGCACPRMSCVLVLKIPLSHPTPTTLHLTMQHPSVALCCTALHPPRPCSCTCTRPCAHAMSCCAHQGVGRRPRGWRRR